MTLLRYQLGLLLIVLLTAASCSNNDPGAPETPDDSEKLTIFFVNDQHGQLENFSKIKHIIDLEKQETNVLVACSGDIFSGNPVVDNYPEKGFPIIDVMNKTGFDISVLGNHEYDYGVDILKDRMDQAEFDWVCANVDPAQTTLPEPDPYRTISVGELKIAFLGLVETNGKRDDVIPSTHPWKVQDLIFQRPESVVDQYAGVKDSEDADVYIALTHLGHSGYNGALGDYQLARDFPYFDLIIGGHSHYVIDTVVNSIPVVQAGSNLNYLGKIQLAVKDKEVVAFDFDLIRLDTYDDSDEALDQLITQYNDQPALEEVIGFANQYQGYGQVGCFFTDALLGAMNVDMTFQNTGGIRSDIEAGDVTRRHIYQVDPFNNGTVIYEMTVREVKDFLIGTRSGFFYAGLVIERSGDDLIIKKADGTVLEDGFSLTIGLNDYIPAVHDAYFPSDVDIQDKTSAETLMYYLENIENEIDYDRCERYFRYE